MSKKLFARGSDGLIAICDGTTTTQELDAPGANIAKMWFHTDLEYMKVVKTITGTANFPAHPGIGGTNWGYQTLDQNIIAEFDVGEIKTPMCIGYFSDGQLIADFTMIQYVAVGSWRSVGLMIGDKVSLVERFLPNQYDLPAMSKDYTIHVLGYPDTPYSAMAV